MKKHRFARFWCRMILVPLIIYLLLSLTVLLTLANPDFLIAKMHEHKIAEEITPLLPEILGVNDPVVQRMSFDVDWVKGNLDSLTREVVDYTMGRRSEILLSLDVAPIYEQLTLEEKEGGTQLSNLSELSIKTHGDEANLYLRYKGSAFVQFLDKLNEFSQTNRLVDFGVIVVVFLSSVFLLYRLRAKFFEIIGPTLAAQNLSLIIIIIGFQWYYKANFADRIVSRLTENWQMFFYNFGLDVIKSVLFYLIAVLTVGVILGFAFFVLSGQVRKAAKPVSI